MRGLVCRISYIEKGNNYGESGRTNTSGCDLAPTTYVAPLIQILYP